MYQAKSIVTHATWQRYGNIFCFNLYIDIDSSWAIPTSPTLAHKPNSTKQQLDLDPIITPAQPNMSKTSKPIQALSTPIPANTNTKAHPLFLSFICLY
jgi:hypothetical protein